MLPNSFVATPALAKLLNGRRPEVYTTPPHPRPNGPTSPDTSNDPQRLVGMEVEQPVFLYNHAIQIVDDYNPDHDNYVDQSAFAHLNDNCYVCASPLVPTDRPTILDVVRTSCHCKSVIHIECWKKLSQYTIAHRGQDEKAWTMVRACGLCRGPFLGAMDEQFDVACMTYRTIMSKNNLSLAADFFALPNVVNKPWCLMELSKIIFSIKQIVKYIRRQWQSTCDYNPIIAGLMLKLSSCYRMVYDLTVNGTHGERQQQHYLLTSFVAGTFSLALHGNSTTHDGLFNLDFIVPVLNQTNLPCVQEQRRCVVDYLFRLIATTTDANYLVATSLLQFTSASTCDLSLILPADHERRRTLHAGAQHYLLQILHSDILRTEEHCDESLELIKRTLQFLTEEASWVGDKRCPPWVEDRPRFRLLLHWNEHVGEYQAFDGVVVVIPKQPDYRHAAGRPRLEQDTVRLLGTGDMMQPSVETRNFVAELSENERNVVDAAWAQVKSISEEHFRKAFRELPENERNAFLKYQQSRLDNGHAVDVAPPAFDSCIIVLSNGMFRYIISTIRASVNEDERRKRAGLVGAAFTFDQKALMKQLLTHESACTRAQKRGQVHHLFRDRQEGEGGGDRVPICERMCEEFGWNDLLEHTLSLPHITGTVRFVHGGYVFGNSN